MNDALVDAFLHQVIIGGRVNGAFTSKAYDDMWKSWLKIFTWRLTRIKWKIDKRYWKIIFMNAMTYLKIDWVVLDRMIF